MNDADVQRRNHWADLLDRLADPPGSRPGTGHDGVCNTSGTSDA